MKRLIAIAGAGAMLLSAVTPAFAYGSFYMPSSDTNNFAIVDNTAVAKSSTGANWQTGGSNYLITGIAVSDSTAVVVANTNVVNCRTCRSTGDVNNMALIDNTSIAKSDTGGQSPGGSSW